MKIRKKEGIFIFLILVILLFVNYSWLDALIINSFSDYELVKIDRVIDGDTIKANETSIRLLGINTPEKGEKGYQEAKEFLEKMVLNKLVQLEYVGEREDRYGRTLAYVFVNGENINSKIVENGLGNYYFPSGNNIYSNELKKSWNVCIENNKNLCEKSENICAKCIFLKEFDYNSQEVVLSNSCNYSCNLKNWKIKDERRKNFIFPNINLDKDEEIKIKVGENQDTSKILFWKGETYVWTRTGDTLFLRDDEGKLVLWGGY